MGCWLRTNAAVHQAGRNAPTDPDRVLRPENLRCRRSTSTAATISKRPVPSPPIPSATRCAGGAYCADRSGNSRVVLDGRGLKPRHSPVSQPRASDHSPRNGLNRGLTTAHRWADTAICRAPRRRRSWNTADGHWRGPWHTPAIACQENPDRPLAPSVGRARFVVPAGSGPISRQGGAVWVFWGMRLWRVNRFNGRVA